MADSINSTTPAGNVGEVFYEGSSSVPVAMPSLDEEALDESDVALKKQLQGESETPAGPDKITEGEESEAKADKPADETESATAEAAEKPEKASEKAARKNVRVPLAELIKERESRQTLEKQLTELREANARTDERTRVLSEQAEAARKELQARERGEQQADPEPDRNEFPLEHQDWQIRQLRKQNEWLYAAYQQQAAAQGRTQFATHIQASEAQFAAANPQYYPSLDKLGNHLHKLFSPFVPDFNQRRQVIGDWTNWAIQSAVQQGRNPSELIYSACKEIGLTEAEAQQAAQEAENVQDSVEAATGRPSSKTMASAIRASRTLSNASGSTPTPAPRYSDLANMSEEAWEEYSSKVRAAGGDPLRVALNQNR
jgi:hypothetical protein